MRATERDWNSAPKAPRCTTTGSALGDANQLEERIAECREAIQIIPTFRAMYADPGNALVTVGRESKSIEEFETVFWPDPKSALAHNDLGTLLRKVPGLLTVTRKRAAGCLVPENYR